MIDKLIVYGLKRKKTILLIYNCFLLCGLFSTITLLLGGNSVFNHTAFKVFMILFSVLQILPIFMPIRMSKFVFYIVIGNILILSMLFLYDIFKINYYSTIFICICLLIDSTIFIIDNRANVIDKYKIKNNIFLIPTYCRIFIVKYLLILILLSFSIICKDLLINIYIIFFSCLISVSIDLFILPYLLKSKLKIGYKKNHVSFSKSLLYKLLFLQEKLLLYLFRKKNISTSLFNIILICLTGYIFYNMKDVWIIFDLNVQIIFVNIVLLIIFLQYLIFKIKNNILKIPIINFVFNIFSVLISLIICKYELNLGGIAGIALLLSFFTGNIYYFCASSINQPPIKSSNYITFRSAIEINRIFFKPLFLIFCCFSIGLIPLLTENDVIWKLFSLIVCLGSFFNFLSLCFYAPLLYLNNSLTINKSRHI